MANSTMGLIGRKLGMTQIFQADGDVIACTVIETGPCTVLQVKRSETRDGYDALQLGFDVKKERRGTKAEIGHATKAGAALPKVIREFRVVATDLEGVELGKKLLVTDLFEVGQKVDVVGTSKGKGTAGVMKRYNFKGFIRTHGTHEFFRHGGSIGTRLTPGFTLKGKKMPGRMGNRRVTMQNLDVVRVDAERNLVFLRGGVPGPNGGFVTVRKAVKAK